MRAWRVARGAQHPASLPAQALRSQCGDRLGCRAICRDTCTRHRSPPHQKKTTEVQCNADKCNVFNLIKLFADETELEQISGYYKSGKRGDEPFGYGHAKMLLAGLIEAHFAEARQKRQHLVDHPEIVEEALQKSAERARKVAKATIERCKRACGLI